MYVYISMEMEIVLMKFNKKKSSKLNGLEIIYHFISCYIIWYLSNSGVYILVRN
jgi:hypothetical protein